METQYIGARYVPKFYENPDTGDMTWKSGVGYEGLTVVTWMDDTFTSKKPVPSTVGNPADNREYWAKTSNFNAALEALQNTVAQLGEVVGELEIEVKKKKPVFFTPAGYPDYTDGIELISNDINVLQGGCVLPDGKIVQYVTNSDNSVGYLMLLDSNGVLLQNNSADYGHGNDLMWSENSNRLYMTGSDGSTIEVFTFVGSVIAHESTISVAGGIAVQGMVEIGNDVYCYDQSTGNVYKTTTAFSAFELVKESAIPVGTSYLHQGIASDGDFLYWLGYDNAVERTVVFVYDLDGEYVDGWSYSFGWKEGEWIDFFGKHAYVGFIDKDIPMYVIRKDQYRNDKLSYSPAQMVSSGKMTPFYVYLDSTAAGGFKNGVTSDEPFNKSELICKIVSGFTGVCIRQASTNKRLRLYDISCELRGDATLDELYLARVVLTLHTDALKCTTPATVLRSIINGDIESDISNCNRAVICGSITGTLTGNNNIVTGSVTGTNNITPA